MPVCCYSSPWGKQGEWVVCGECVASIGRQAQKKGSLCKPKPVHTTRHDCKQEEGEVSTRHYCQRLNGQGFPTTLKHHSAKR